MFHLRNEHLDSCTYPVFNCLVNLFQQFLLFVWVHSQTVRGVSQSVARRLISSQNKCHGLTDYFCVSQFADFSSLAIHRVSMKHQLQEIFPLIPIIRIRILEFKDEVSINKKSPKYACDQCVHM